MWGSRIYSSCRRHPRNYEGLVKLRHLYDFPCETDLELETEEEITTRKLEKIKQEKGLTLAKLPTAHWVISGTHDSWNIKT